MATEYRIYSNSGSGGPIDFTTIVATVSSGTTWTSGDLGASASWQFAVRAYDTVSGLEESNLDARVSVVTDASLNDITNVPLPPTGLTVTPTAGGNLRVNWFATVSRRTGNAAIAFKVYIGTGGTPSYTSPVATITAVPGFAHYFTDLTGLTAGVAYTVGVRAANATGTEGNTTTATATTDATAPSNVDSLTATAIS